MSNIMYSWMALYKNDTKEKAEKVIVAPTWAAATDEAVKEQRLNAGWRLDSLSVLSEMPVLISQPISSP